MQGKVEICGVNTARLKTLTHEEMDTLLRLSKAGDKKAREKLIEGNLRLVLSVIQRFDNRGESPGANTNSAKRKAPQPAVGKPSLLTTIPVPGENCCQPLTFLYTTP